ncbi:hypothetical protein VTN00DRAFT_10231 [Thermoascus crustaceus]|uniref:uncharacterized protein n=1 Tax=Thermoascus crustaceus TaxID=5088 RepID=UPI003743E27B
MAHNMFPDNLSYGPECSLTITPPPASSVPSSSPPLNSPSPRKRLRPLVLQTRPGLLPQTIGQPAAAETPPYVPHHYSFQPPYGLSTHLQPNTWRAVCNEVETSTSSSLLILPNSKPWSGVEFPRNVDTELRNRES